MSGYVWKIYLQCVAYLANTFYIVIKNLPNAFTFIVHLVVEFTVDGNDMPLNCLKLWNGLISLIAHFDWNAYKRWGHRVCSQKNGYVFVPRRTKFEGDIKLGSVRPSVRPSDHLVSAIETTILFRMNIYYHSQAR